MCGALGTSGIDYRLLAFREGSESDLDGQPDHLVVIYPTWWGGPPSAILDWLQNTLCDRVDGNAETETSALASVRRISVVTTHGSSRLINLMQGQPGKLTWSRVVIPQCAPGAVFDWLALYKIDKTTEAERTGFIEKVTSHFTSARVPA